MTLPTKEQFLTSNYYLNIASDHALLVHWLDEDFHKNECLKQFQRAAEVLGMELIERVPNSMREAG